MSARIAARTMRRCNARSWRGPQLVWLACIKARGCSSQPAEARVTMPSSAIQTASSLNPPCDGGPVPGWPTTHGPLGLGEVGMACPPGVHGATTHTEAFGYLDGSHGVTGHGISVGKVLTDGKECGHNTHMAET